MKRKSENKIINTFHLFWRAFGSYKKQIAFLIFAGFFGGLLEGVGINAVIPLFSFIVKDTNAELDTISRFIQNTFNFLHIPYQLKFILILIAVLFIGKAIMVFLTNYLTDRIRTNYVRDVREKLFSKTLNASWPYLSKQKIGYLEKVLINDIGVHSSLLSYMSSSVILITNTLIYIFIAFNISAQITLITIAVGGIFFLIFKPMTYRIRVLSHKSAEVLKQVANYINESMIGMKTIKAMALENKVVIRGRKFFEDLRSIEIQTSVMASITYVTAQPLSIFLILGLFAFSYKTTDFNFASFAVIIYAINKIFSYIQDGQTRLQNISGVYPYLTSAFNYDDWADQHKESNEGLTEFTFKKQLSFNKVSFSYDNKHQTLKDISFKIDKGSSIGIIGPSGSGKTTLVDLILHLIKPTEGKILVDDLSISDINRNTWKNKIGYVSQEIFLLNDTIENNIKFFNPEISDETMIMAAKMANIYDFIQEKPLGFKTIAGERGTELSGGQRQRIALARVLARKPEILILDEATSALDNESEMIVQDAIRNLKGDTTIIIIAHRYNSIMDTDNLLVLEKGQIIESGSTKTLLDNPASYFHQAVKTQNAK